MFSFGVAKTYFTQHRIEYKEMYLIEHRTDCGARKIVIRASPATFSAYVRPVRA